MSKTKNDPRVTLANNFLAQVKGKTIVNVYYDDGSNMPVIMLSDGSAIFIQRDDEGNGPGTPVHVSGESGNQKEVGMWELY